MLSSIKAASESKSPTQTRGSPQSEAKYSRSTYSKHDKRLYASGVPFLHKNFPPENERLSEAHRLAVLWARNQNTVVGDQTLIFMNDVCYLVECFDDALNYYQVEDVVSKAEFDTIYKEIKKNGKVGKIKSILATANGYDSNYRQHSTFDEGKPSADSYEAKHRRESPEVVRLDREQASGRERSSNNGSRDSQSSSEDRQKYSRELDTEGNVNKSRFEEPDVKFGEKIKAKFTTAKDKIYIDTVDETYGIQKYLTTQGNMKHADAFVQQVRAAETMAQTMIGVAQYDIVKVDGKRLGDGVTKIFKKYKIRKIERKFYVYLLHQLNVDRMTLEERSLAKREELLKEFEKAEAAFHRARRDSFMQ